MTGGYLLIPEAEADLRGIIRYTRDRWGDAQARAYVSKLEQAIGNLANGQSLPKNLDDLYPGLRLLRCERHYIFCLPRSDAPMLVVAIFHERMDLIVRVADRLR